MCAHYHQTIHQERHTDKVHRNDWVSGLCGQMRIQSAHVASCAHKLALSNTQISPHRQNPSLSRTQTATSPRSLLPCILSVPTALKLFTLPNLPLKLLMLAWGLLIKTTKPNFAGTTARQKAVYMASNVTLHMARRSLWSFLTRMRCRLKVLIITCVYLALIMSLQELGEFCIVNLFFVCN